MGASWAMRVIVPTTWYPGNGDEATQQVLGPQEMPSKWTGEWRRTMLGQSPCLFASTGGSQTPVVNPIDLMNIVESMARAGQLLRVVWLVQSDQGLSSQQGRLVREGRISELSFKPTRVQDIEWEVEFTWKGRGKTTARVTSTRGNTINSDSAAYLNKLNKLIAANTRASFAKFNPSAFSLGQLEALASFPTQLTDGLARSVQQLTGQVGQVIAIAATLTSQPTSVANRAIDLARNTVAQANQFYDTLSQIPIELLVKSPGTQSKLADLLRATKVFGAQSDAARDLARSGQQFTAKLQQQAQSSANVGRVSPTRLTDPNQIERVYITRNGDTPQTVSQNFYKTPDHAVDILRANRLPWYTPTFSPGKILIIPVLPVVDATRSV